LALDAGPLRLPNQTTFYYALNTSKWVCYRGEREEVKKNMHFKAEIEKNNYAPQIYKTKRLAKI